MMLLNRVKCLVSITGGVIASVDTIDGYADLPYGVANVAYLLEDDAGLWETGIMASASARAVEQVSSGHSGFGGTASGLTLSLIAPRAAYVDSGPIGDLAANSVATATGADACAMGRSAEATAAAALAFGPGARALGVRTMACGFKAFAEEPASGAIGYKAAARHEGETALGHYMLPHTSQLAVCASYSAGTPTAWPVRALVDVDSYGYITEGGALDSGVLGPITAQSSESFVVRVQGTVFADLSDNSQRRCFSVDFATYKGTLLYNSTATTHSTGAAGIAFNVSAAGVMTINPGTAGEYLRVRGVLRVDKVPVINY